MKKLIVALLFSAVLTPRHSEAQDPTPPPDFYHDFLRQGFACWENPGSGWVVNTNGQTCPDIKYVTDGALPRAYIQKNAKVSFVLASVDTSVSTPDTLRRLDMSFTGEMFQAPDPIAVEQRGERRNFYLPHCGTNGVTDIHGYNRIVYKNIYPHIDLWIYAGRRGQKMAIQINPGASPSDVQLTFTGQDQIDLDVFGNLKLLMQDKWIVLPEAVAYQYDTDNTIIPANWTAEYVPNQNSGVVGFTFGEYDDTKPLVLLIGPPPPLGGGNNYEEQGLCWSTYFGGSGDDYIVQSAQDSDGNYYVTGSTTSTIESFPSAPGVEHYFGGIVTFGARFNFADELVWKTFFGGNSGQFCLSRGCAVTENSTSAALYVAGNTDSGQLAVQANNNEHMLGQGLPKMTFIAKFRQSDGERVWASYFEAQHISGIASGANGRVFLTGRSHYSIFPVDQDYLDDSAPLGSAYWSSSDSPGTVSGFVAMINPQDRLNWFTFITNNPEQDQFGNWTTFGWGTSEIAVSADRVVVQGASNCPTLPDAGCPNGAYCEGQFAYGQTEAVIYEFNLSGVPVWSTYFGETGVMSFDQSLDDYPGTTIAIDPVTGDVVVAGSVANGGSIPIEPGSGWYSSQTSSPTSPFIARFSGQTRDLVWSSYVPVSPGYYPAVHAVAFDDEGALFISGSTFGLSVPLNDYGGYYHESTIYTNEGTNEDAFLICISPDQDPGPDFNYAVRFATYFGGEAAQGLNEAIYDIAQRTTNGNMYVAGRTSKGEIITSYFPLDNNGGNTTTWSDWLGGEQDAFISSFCPEAPTLIPTALPHTTLASIFWQSQDDFVLRGLPEGIHLFELLDIDGRLIDSGTVNFSQGVSSPVEVQHLSPGIYVIHLAGQSIRFSKL